MKTKTFKSIRLLIFSFISYGILILCIVSACQIFGISVDYANYEKIFSRNYKGAIEPFFRVMRSYTITHFDGNLIVIFFTTAFLSLVLKVKAFYKLCDTYVNLLVCYCSYIITFFFLYEYTQIRASLSIAFFFVSIPSLAYKQYYKYYLLCICALMCHYSAIATFFIPFFCMFESKKVYILLPLIGFFLAISLYLMDINLSYDLLLSLQEFAGIQKLGNNKAFNPFNLKYLGLLLFFIVFTFYSRNLTTTDIVLLKVLSCGLCFFYYLNPLHLPVVSIRFAEYFCSVFVIYFVNVYRKNHIIKEKALLLFLILVFFLFYSYATLSTTIV